MTHTTLAPTGAVSNRLARRGLLASAGLLAAVASSEVKTAVGTSVAHRVPPVSDAELLALCNQFCAIEQDHYAAAQLFWLAGRDDEAGEQMERMTAKLDPLVSRMIKLPPATMAGATAMARCVAQWSHGDFALELRTDEMLTRTLLRGLVGRA